MPKDGALTCAYWAESTSTSSKSLKTLEPGEAVKVVVPVIDVDSEGIIWNEVFVDKDLKKKGWISKSYIYISG
ncbi:hypothetical protein I5Q83_20440 [Enterocloster clostridioformis]|nr:hypothetical protein [Enterocloster clostridioformis]QQQ98514.1 hypothetical protein I5Q83_20440 [Enterocloster clostridioformis]